MPLKIYILAGDFRYNKGDSVNFLSQINLIRSHFEDVSITACCQDPEAIDSWFPVRLIRRGIFPGIKQARAIAKSDLVIWGGGALITDHGCRLLIAFWIPYLLLAKIVLRKKVIAWSHGVVLETYLGRFLAKIAYGLTDSIAARDQGSKELIESLKLKKKVLLTADVASCSNIKNQNSLFSTSEKRSKTGRNSIGLSFTFWHLYNDKNKILPYALRKKNKIDLHGLGEVIISFAKLINLLIESLDCDITLLPRYSDPLWLDLEILNKIKLASKYNNEVSVFKETLVSPENYLSLIGSFDALISVPMHDAIMAVTMGTAVIIIPYEKKCEEFARDINAQDRAISWGDFLKETGPQTAFEVTKKIFNRRDQIVLDQYHYLESLRDRARLNLDPIYFYTKDKRKNL